MLIKVTAIVGTNNRRMSRKDFGRAVMMAAPAIVNIDTLTVSATVPKSKKTRKEEEMIGSYLLWNSEFGFQYEKIFINFTSAIPYSKLTAQVPSFRSKKISQLHKRLDDWRNNFWVDELHFLHCPSRLRCPATMSVAEVLEQTNTMRITNPSQ